MNTTKKKSSTLKKVLKWSAVSVVLILLVLISIPFVFKDKIVQMVSNTINNNINATVTFTEPDLSLLKSFPLASLTVKNVAVINKEPFLGDTLFNAETLSLDMKITELFKKPNEAIDLKNIATSNGKINIVFNKNDAANFDIAIKKETVATENDNSFSFNIEGYEANNIQFNYHDENSNMHMQLDSIFHTGKGNFAKDILDLDTKTTAKVSFDYDNVNYIKNVAISLDALLGIDLKNSKYTFKENTGYINQLPLTFNGFIQLVNEGQLYDLSFKTPTSSFKNALGLLPKQYAGNLKSVKTAGNFDMNGVVKGMYSNTKIPTFNIAIASKDAMFKYADLPKSVEDIHINSTIINTTGNLKDTYLDFNKFSFKIDEDAFSGNGSVKNITTNPYVNFTAKGIVNLANINKVYPVKSDKQLEGILNANVSASFDLNSIEKANYKNIKNEGTISVTNFKYDGDDVANPFFIDKTAIAFNTNSITLNEFSAKTGSSDINLKGNLDNFYGFVFKDQVLKGNFTLNSNYLKVADFLDEAPKKQEEKPTSTLKIPSFLDVKLNASVNKVTYDNIDLANVSGTVFIKDEVINLQNLKTAVFGGNIGFDGNVSTKDDVAKFAMNLNLKELNISDSFGNLEMLKAIAPIAKTIEGKINSTIKITGNLNDKMSPDLATISGELLGQLLNTKLKASNSNLLAKVSENVKFLDVNKLNLNDVSTILSFKNGEVTVKPFTIKYQDIAIKVNGKHGFNNTMNYNLEFDVPVKYLGTEVTSALAKLAPKDAGEIKSIPIKGNLTGNFASPSFTTNMKTATTDLVKDLIEKQKQKLIGKGTDKLKGLLGLDKKDASKTDSTKTTKTKTEDKIKDVLGGLFGKRKKDTTK